MSNRNIQISKQIKRNYAKDKNSIYFLSNDRTNNLIKISADVNSFIVFENSDYNGSSYAKDKDNIYCNGEILKEADYDTFEIFEIDDKYKGTLKIVKDKNQKYSECKSLEISH